MLRDSSSHQVSEQLSCNLASEFRERPDFSDALDQSRLLEIRQCSVDGAGTELELVFDVGEPEGPVFHQEIEYR